VGYRRNEDLARDVGCSPDRLSHWLQLAKPPARMLKGFDRQLARALKTTRQMLFVDYARNPPESAPRHTWAETPAPWNEPGFSALPSHMRLQSLMHLVGEETLHQVAELMLAIAKARMAEQQREFEDTILQYEDADNPALPELPPHLTPEAIRKRRRPPDPLGS
jgi:hypothetical protein